MSTRSLLILSMLASTAAAASPTIDPAFGDHAVVQRGAPVRVRGTANPGEQVTVALAGQTRNAKAGKDGLWAADFPALAEGSTYRLEVHGKDGSTTSSGDLVAGDVWLCSGQSNMEYPLYRAMNAEGDVANANDPQLRLMKVPQNRQTAPQTFLAQDVKWRPTTPESAKQFSAACYFMARALRQSHGVPVGAIDSTWGGTEIRAWMDDAAVRSTGGAEEIALLQEYRRDPQAMIRKFDSLWENWWRTHTNGAPPWLASDRLSWTPMLRIGLWEQWGDPKFADFNGAIWARVRFTLTPEQAAQGATLSLGAIDDLDRTFVNGQVAGQTSGYNLPRNYMLRPGVLKAGGNEVVVYVLDTGGGGGFWSPPEMLKLSFADGSSKPLAEGWQYSVIPAEVGVPPTPPWDQGVSATTLYNGMIAPLGPIHLKGAAWYQGEADVGRSGYDQRLLAMMKSWRGQFREPQLSFLIVGLAGFGPMASKPTASGWAATINEQRKGTDADPRSALVSAIDIGVPADIHPTNKQEVGRRLTLAAETLAYGDPKGVLEPKPLRAARNASAVVVTFDKPVISYSGAPVGVELCAETQDSCRYANAQLDGSTMIVAGDGKPATRVRYAWADYPIVNVYGPERLPVPPFELPIAQ
ncbi:MAG: sialate O-acetylesterase [Sphingomicrobium sp.]